MRWRVLLFFSLGANIVLAMLWFASARRNDAPAAAEANPERVSNPSVKTNVLLRRQFFSWAEVESADYPAYIANLRGIGCPEQTIRDIIIADINAHYATRRATEVTTPEQQWWRSEPDSNVVRIAVQKIRALDEERRNLLAQLLGPDWEGGDLASLPRPSRPGVLLDGPLLGALSAETKQAIQEVSARAQDRLEAYVQAQQAQGQNPDPTELARLRQQTRDELAGLLNPSQLEEYLLRYSQNANTLRAELGQLDHFNVTPEEFRAIFRATDDFEQRLQLLAGANDPNTVGQRNALLEQRENAIRLALGPDRYREYVLLQDPAYRQAYATAQESGTPEIAVTLYEISLATAEQQALLAGNTNLTAEQRAIELKRIELEQLKAAAQAMGQEVLLESAPMPLNIPPATSSIRTHSYVLGVGDTIASVAVRYGVSLSDLRAVNPDVDIHRLKPGDSIQIPAP